MSRLARALQSAAGNAGGGASSGWDISTAVYSQSFSVSAQEATASGVCFDDTGSKMYVVGISSDSVHQYDLSSPWEVLTATYLRTLNIAAYGAAPRDIFFKTDGTEMYIAEDVQNAVDQYTLSTAWDISTASYTTTFSVSSEEAGMNAAVLSTDGSNLYIIGTGTDSVYQYAMSVAWDISSASLTSSYSVGAVFGVPSGLFFSDDGSYMYVVGYGVDAVAQYTLSTPWDVSTSSYMQQMSVSTQDSSVYGICFGKSGTRLYAAGSSTDAIYQYNLT